MVLNIGHRGFGVHSLENTLMSFKRAIDTGLDMVELDVRLTRDREVVVFHDKGLKRLASINAKINDLDYDIVKELRISLKKNKLLDIWGSIPTLDEVLSLSKNKIGLNIEIKADGKHSDFLINQVIERVNHHNMKDEVVISSFSKKILEIGASIDEGFRYGLVFHKRVNSKQFTLNDRPLYSIHPYKFLVNKKLVQTAKEQGLKIYPWTANSEKLMRKLISLGVDGIITNYPIKLANLKLILRDKSE
ncbi:MAG: glycerophosphodiester phosphodiesterase [Spirochaetota bacterium]|nr:glycerophosphodiester phosphodiesterase [Spirochaetota bacterium]